MFGIIRKRKPIIFAHWYVPLMDFESDTGQFFQSLEEEMTKRRVPELVVERIHFKNAGLLSANRAYLRLRRERVVIDVCSAPFGTSWWFSARAAVLPGILRAWELLLFLLGIGSFFALYWQLYGLMVGGIVFGSSLLFLLVVFLTARNWSGLDEALLYMPVIGALYERFARPESYHRQDQRLMFGDLVNTIIRLKVVEFCMAGGINEPEFITVKNPEQILTERELVKYAVDELSDKPAKHS